MKKFRLSFLLIIAGIASVGLSACQHIEQAACNALEDARQTALEALQQASDFVTAGPATAICRGSH